MALTSGTKLGPYEIQSPLGSGGMGEVYRARDTRLDRTVAVKILPSHLSDKPEAKQRFEAARSVNTGRSLPIENVNQLPRVPDKIHLQLSLLINRQLGCRVQDTRALALIGVVHIEFASTIASIFRHPELF